MQEWPFSDPENLATITSCAVMQGGQPILWVSHDADDGSWQFHTGGPVEMADALVVSLRSVFRLDPSVGEFADLPLGWKAWRAAAGERWQRLATD